MRINKPFLATGLFLSLTTLNAEASLTPYTVNGINLVRMQGAGFDVSFTQDANLFKTLATNNTNLVSQIIAITPTYSDPSWGQQVIDASDFNTTTGKMSWWGGKAFINYLNNISYAGSNQWSLPGVADTGTAGCNSANSGTDCGYNVDPSTSPLAQLYYGELAKKGYLSPTGSPQSDFGILGTGSGGYGTSGSLAVNGATLTNVQSEVYWMDTEHTPFLGNAWSFITDIGFQGISLKTTKNYAWAVSPGQVTSVPLPSAVWLMGTGLFGLTRLSQRKHSA